MTGIICMWHGLLVDIPNGWALCDGTNGTPDLRERFVRGAPDGIDPGQENGNTVHFHYTSGSTQTTRDLHEHVVEGVTYEPEPGDDDVDDVPGEISEYDIHRHWFFADSDMGGNYHKHLLDLASNNVNHLPPFYEIAFIMKL